MRNINKIFLYIIHSIYFMLESMLVFSFISDYILKFKMILNFKILIILSLFFYFISFILSEIYENRKGINLLESKIFIITGVSASIIAGILIGCEQGFFISVFTIAYFAFLLINAVRINRNYYDKSVNSSVYFRIIKSFSFTILMSPFYIPDYRIIAFENRIIDFVNIYFVVSILHIICVNLNKHFEVSKSVNKDKNLFIFNSIITLFIIAFIFARKEIIGAFDMFKYYISFYTDEFLHKIVTQLSTFMEYMFGTGFGAFLLKFFRRTANEEAPAEEYLNHEEETEKLAEEMMKNSGELGIYKIIYFLLFISIIFILYRSFKKYRFKRQNKEPEKKEFIFKKEVLFNDIKDSFTNIFKKRENLSKERLMYKKTVNELIKDGYEISKITTPNEYISTIVEGDIEKYNFNKITSDYNADRYGKS